eukprot:11103491-Prorocentrum_lima.AAC.1
MRDEAMGYPQYSHVRDATSMPGRRASQQLRHLRTPARHYVHLVITARQILLSLSRESSRPNSPCTAAPEKK